MILQAREPSGTPTVVKSTWIHRIKTHEDKVTLISIFATACDSSSFYQHSFKGHLAWNGTEG